MPKARATLTLQMWGNNLAVRIPAAVARAAQLGVGQPVSVSAERGGVAVRSLGPPRLSLAQRLARFDPETHGGEALATPRIGNEEF